MLPISNSRTIWNARACEARRHRDGCLAGRSCKPRPALIVQSDRFEASTHVAVLLLTSFQADTPLLRIVVPATAETGLLAPSCVMLDRITTAPRNKIRRVIGHLDDANLLAVTRAMAVFLGFA